MRPVLTATLVTLAIAASASAVQAKDSGSTPVALRAASTVVGTVFGLPISIVRNQKRDVVNFTNDLTGNSKNPAVIIAVQPLTFIPGMVNGLFSGIGQAPLNAWKHSAQQPFSPETFSLGDVEK